MKKIKKIVTLMLCMVLVCMSFSACGDKKGNSNSGNNSSGSGEGEVEIMWWTSYATINTNNIQVMIDEFNELHKGDYHVEILYNGDNNALRTKLSTTQQDNLPALITGQPIATPYYAESDVIVPIQKYIDADKEDWTKGIYEVVKTAYSDDEGNLIGWPMGVSSAGWFVNTDLLAAAGYAIENLTSYEKIAEAATAIVDKGLAKNGLAYYYNGIELYDGLTLEGSHFIDQDNGFSGDATSSVLSQGENKAALTAFLNTFGKLAQSKVAYTYGASTDSDVMPAFVQGNIAMFAATNSYTYKLLQYETDFEWSFIPNTSITETGKYKGYALCEGTGTYIVNTGNEKVMQGSYELIKFLAQPKNQEFWCTKTGYIPYTEEAFASEAYQTWMKENLPESVELQAKLKNAESVVRGPYCSVTDAVLSVCQAFMSYMADDPTQDVNELIEERESYLTEAIEIDALRKK